MQLIVTATALLVVPGVIVTWMAASYFVAAHPEEVGEPPEDLPVESVSLHSESGSVLATWHIRAEQSAGVIVLAHPYQGSRLTMVDRARLLHDAGYSIVMMDLQAHGESPGERITIGYLERYDVEAAVRYAREQHPGEPIGIVGFSMGGAATLLATPLHVDAVVLEAVYPHIHAAVHNRIKVKLGSLATLPTHGLLMQFKPRLGISVADLSPISHLPNIGCPVFIMAGTADPHTTLADTEAMIAAAVEPGESWLVEGAGHEDLYEFLPDEYAPRVLSFFKRHLRAARAERYDVEDSQTSGSPVKRICSTEYC